jgi:hypothetical protein
MNGGLMKKKKTSRLRPNKQTRTRLNIQFQKFKKVVDTQLGKINWGKLGIFAIALLLYVAAQGLLGLKAQVIAFSLIKLSTYA